MKRLFWLAVGAGLGAWSLHKVQAKAQRIARGLTPQSLAVRAGNAAVHAGNSATGRFRDFADEVRTGMREREAELREAIELDQAPPDRPGLAPRRVLKARYMIINDDKDGH
jgi:hypothetical protein